MVLGLAALMCSGTAVTTVVIVGLGALLARGWRAAALQTVPLGAVYLWWYVAYGEDAVSRQWPSVSELVRFVARGIDNVFVQLGQFRVVAMLLVLLLVVGCVVSWNDRRKVDGSTSDWRLRLAAPASLAVGGLVFFVVTGVGRTEAYGTSFATRSRYADVGAALLLPAVAVGADALVRRWRQLLVPVCVVLLIGVPFGSEMPSRSAGARSRERSATCSCWPGPTSSRPSTAACGPSSSRSPASPSAGCAMRSPPGTYLDRRPR